MAEFPFYKHPPLPTARAAVDPDLLSRLCEASERAQATLRKLPLDIVRAYVKQLSQLQELIERLSK